MAPPPFATGSLARAMPSGLFNFLPPIHQAEETPFEERIQQGFNMAMSEGLDICLAMSSLTVAIGNRFSKGADIKTLKPCLKNQNYWLDWL